MGSLGTTTNSSDNQFASHTPESTVAAAQQHLQDHGWAVIPDVLTPEENSRVLSQLWAAADKFRKLGDDTYMPMLDPNAANIRVFYLMALDKIFRDLVQHPVAVEMVEKVLGDNWLISNFTANIARPGSKSMALHSDQSLVMPEPWTSTWALNVIWCLEDVYLENGATLFIPGSDKWTTREDIPSNARSLLKPFEAKAGSIVLMNGRVWHTSGANVTKDKDRALLFGYYTVPFLRQQVNWAAKMPEDVKKELSPELTERLGMNVHANMAQVSLLKYLDEVFPPEEQKEGGGEKLSY
ncbi:hypothetical protein AYO21_08089 [Fonsecaea monophora]|uniref:Phytanoyl-CoA dioxygenase n=1 Tax=Fonsecaea monophora TaxID=254056 RepID=A0A177F1M3_9EURO|nr:hypothetical protein AYO21_08089 [Fonsecaea monophora]KAH0846691.1 phytanoyl-CoA dioxygenase family protein [Fonsecaea pedrosoi]OAG37726.1 hypothetical protein AYO21_08089 [Fonsecaea monophora]